MVAVTRLSRIGSIGLMSCLLLAGCRPPEETAAIGDPPRFPDSVAIVTPTAVDTLGALALEAGQLGVIDASALETVAAGGRCALDSVNGKESAAMDVPRASPARFSGWVAAKASEPVIAVMLVGDANYILPAETLLDRPDLAEAIGLREGRVSDYEVIADLRGAHPGVYSVHLLLDDGGNLAKCALNRKVTLR